MSYDSQRHRSSPVWVMIPDVVCSCRWVSTVTAGVGPSSMTWMCQFWSMWYSTLTAMFLLFGCRWVCGY